MNIIEKINANQWVIFFRENLSLIIAIPYIIGGAKQILILAGISVDLLKFFSLSQLFIDGIVTFVFLSFVVICMEIYKALIKLFTQHEEHPEKKFLKKFNIFIFVCLVIYGIILFSVRDFNDKEFNRLLARLFLFGIALLAIQLTIFVKDKTYKVYLYVVSIIYVTGVVFSDSNKIENFEKITTKVKMKNKNSKLSYFNDQYLFYETNPKSDNNKIIIFKIDDLF